MSRKAYLWTLGLVYTAWWVLMAIKSAPLLLASLMISVEGSPIASTELTSNPSVLSSFSKPLR